MPEAEARISVRTARSYGERIVANPMMKEWIVRSSCMRCRVLKYAHLHLLSGR